MSQLSKYYHCFRLFYKGITYDRDYGEEITISIDFPTQPEMENFRLDFQEFCVDSGLIETSAYYPARRIVGFEELETALEKNPDKIWANKATKLLEYDSGYIYLDETKAIEFSHTETIKDI